MDDLLILAQTRWQLRCGIAVMNQWFEVAGLEQHPDKTFIDRIECGFDWLGYQYSVSGLYRVASRALAMLGMGWAWYHNGSPI